MNETLRIIFYVKSIYIFYRHTSIDGFTKLSFGSSKCLFEYCNANVTYSGTEFFGYKDKTGNYNGIVGALMRGEIDTSGKAELLRKMQIGNLVK